MKQYRKYAAPVILRETAFTPAGSLLAGSVVDDLPTIESSGQEVTTFTSDDFTHTWGE